MAKNKNNSEVSTLTAEKEQKKEQRIKKIRRHMPALTIVFATLLFLIGLILIVASAEFIELILRVSVVALLLIYGAVRTIQCFIDNRPTAGAVTLGITWTAALIIVMLNHVQEAVAIPVNILIGAVSLLMGLMRLLICINCIVNKIRGALRNGISALFCILFGLSLIIYPFDSLKLAAIVAGFYLIFYAVTMYGDVFASIFRTDLKENRSKRRVHFAVPNIFTAMTPARLIAQIDSDIAAGKLESGMIIEAKDKTEFDHVNLEILVHMRKEGANKFGHVDIAIGETIYSYGTYDTSKDKYGGFVSQGTVIIVPKIGYLKHCLSFQKKYVIGFGACLSDEQLDNVKKKIDEMLENCEPLESEYEKAIKEGRDGSEYTDSASEVMRACGGKVYTVSKGFFRRYFGINTNCVHFADWLLSDSGIDAISFSSLYTPGSYYSMLDNMLRRGNTRVIRKISYIKADEIYYTEKLTGETDD